MREHVKSFLAFFLKAQQVEIQSRYDLRQSLLRVMDLNNEGQVRVRTMKGNRLIVFGAQHGYRANVLPIFAGGFEDRHGHPVLRGCIRLNRGVRIILGMICFFAFVFFPLKIGLFAGEVPFIVGVLALIGLLEFFYCIGKGDAAKITRNLNRVLHSSEGT